MSKLCSLFFVIVGLLGVQQAYAQSADIPKHGSVTGLSDPEPPDPRYVKASELAKLKEQVQALQKAYGELLQEQVKQAERISTLEQAPTPTVPLTPAGKLPDSSMSLRKP